MRRFFRQTSHIAIIVLVLSLLALVFRLTKLVIPQILIAVLTPAAAIFLVYSKKTRPSFLPNHRPSRVLLLPLPAALLLAGAAVLQLVQLRWAAAAGNLIGACCIAWIAVRAISRKVPHLVCYLILTSSLILKLIPDFRTWSVDPVIMDYCFSMFAVISTMLAVLYLGSFVLDEGKRRLTGGFCICGVVFCCMTAADGDVADALVSLGYAMFLFAELWELLLPEGKSHPKERNSDNETTDRNHL